MPAKERVFYLDAIRAYAIVWVVVSHAFAGVCAGMNSYPLHVWWVFNLFDSIMRPCVPLFIMISGTLILGSAREETYLAFQWRRYSKLVAPFFVWSMIYAFYDARLNAVPFSLAKAVLKFLAGPTAGHLYFMYIILGLYLFAPMLRAFVRASSRRDQAVVLLLWLGFLILQFFYPEAIGGGPATTMIDYGGYFLLGYFLNRTGAFKGRAGWLLSLCVLIVLANAWATYVLTVANEGAIDEKFYFGTTPLVAVYSGAFFLAVKDLVPDAWQVQWPRLGRAVGYLSLESYNIYLMHAYFLWLFTQGAPGFVLGEKTGGSPMIGVPLTSAAILICSLVVSAAAKRIPCFGRLLAL